MSTASQTRLPHGYKALTFKLDETGYTGNYVAIDRTGRVWRIKNTRKGYWELTRDHAFVMGYTSFRAAKAGALEAVAAI